MRSLEPSFDAPSARRCQFRCDADIVATYDLGVIYQLWAMWNKVDPRYLTLRLRACSDLPAMDDNGTTDAYVVAYLVPPDPRLPPSPIHEDPPAADDGLKSETDMTGGLTRR